MEAKTRDLSDSLQKVGQAMYASAGSAQGQQPGQEQQAGSNSQSPADGEAKADDKKTDKEEPVEGEVVN